MSGYEFHPEARVDLAEIWELICADNLDAADRVIAEILAAVDGLVPFPKNSACYEPFGADDGKPTARLARMISLDPFLCPAANRVLRVGQSN